MVDDLMVVEEEVAVMGEVGVAVAVAVVMEITGVVVAVVGVMEAEVGEEEENQEAMVENPLEEGATHCKHLKLAL